MYAICITSVVRLPRAGGIVLIASTRQLSTTAANVVHAIASQNEVIH